MDGKRPDGVSLVPWQSGKSICWGFTVTCPLLSHILTEHLTRQVRQQRWHLPARRTSMLTLVPVTSLSQLRSRPWAFSSHQLATSWLILEGINTGEARETSYLFQRISVLVQRFNAVLLHDSLPTADIAD